MNISLFLVVTIGLYHACVDAKAGLSPAIDQIQQRTLTFMNAGYTEQVDGMAREMTKQLLTPSPDKIATSFEADVMVDAHLKTELYYAFNTQYGTGRERDHRIVYDFICQLDKSATWTSLQKGHFTILTVLSLAAQEYFWNEKSTIKDLQNRVRRELRYGLFKKEGHKLNISSAVHLDDSYLDHIITEWVNEKLREKLSTLMRGFKDRTLGKTYTDIMVSLVDLGVQFHVKKASLSFANLSGLCSLPSYGLDAEMDLNPVSSLGDGMCGEHSLFIPTDGALSNISEGNGRYKILRSILDNAHDNEARRLYLLNSKYMDGFKFEELMTDFSSRLRAGGKTQQASKLEEMLTAYKIQKVKYGKEKEERRAQQKQKLLSKVVGLTSLREIFNVFNNILLQESRIDELLKSKAFRDIIDSIILLGLSAEVGGHSGIKERWDTIKTRVEEFDQQIIIMGVDSSEKDDVIRQQYALIIETLKDIISPDVLLSNAEAFSAENLCIFGYSNFINDVCQAICAFTGNVEAASAISILWDQFNSQKDLYDMEIDKQLLHERLAIVGSLSVLPGELSPTALANEVELFAKRPGELSGWLPCDAVYTQLWATLNNLNVFVFSRGEQFGRSPLDVIIRTQNTYDQVAIPYAKEGVAGKHLATVILTSPTARNVYLDKGPAHYDKFIKPDDYAAIAKAQRHLAWKVLDDEYKYAQYPGA